MFTTGVETPWARLVLVPRICARVLVLCNGAVECADVYVGVRYSMSVYSHRGAFVLQIR